MNKLKCEFQNKNDGNVLIISDDGVTLLKDNPAIVERLFYKIKNKYPGAFAGIVEKYAASKRNLSYFKYLCVRRFIQCNFGEYDDKYLDIDEEGRWNLEKVKCPLRGECKFEGIICQPIPGSCLSAHEIDIVSLLCEGKSLQDIADRHNISVNTVRSHRRNIYAKLGIHNIRGLMNWYNNSDR